MRRPMMDLISCRSPDMDGWSNGAADEAFVMDAMEFPIVGEDKTRVEMSTNNNVSRSLPVDR